MIVTLLTDMGTKDAAIAGIRAILMQQMPDVEVVDLSHGVTRHNWREAAYLLMDAYDSFPQGTVHIAPVAPFMERQPRMITATKDGHIFIAPDNGLLYAALGAEAMTTARLCQQYEKPYSMTAWISDASSVAQQLSQGAEMPYSFFEPNMPLYLSPPQVTPIGIACRPLCSDRYQNIVLNIKKNDFERIVDNRQFRIKTFRGAAITTVSQHYNEVPEGDPLCRFNKLGYMEVAVNHGSAMELFGIDPADANALDYHTIRISV